jgi:hypothetical protein
MGFDFKIPANRSDCLLLTGVKSEERVFEKNDVTIDFSNKSSY